MFWAASLDVVMPSEKDLIQLSSTMWTVPIPTLVVVWIHTYPSSIDYLTITLCSYEFPDLYRSVDLMAITDWKAIPSDQ